MNAHLHTMAPAAALVSPTMVPNPLLAPFDTLDTEALRQLAQTLDGLHTWAGWAHTLPVVQGARDQVLAIERELLRFSPLLPFLAQVCWHPRSTLRLDEERLPVERARRIPERAVAALLAHPEDWSGRTLRGVHAARILSTVAEDDWGIFENRLAVQLVHHLLRWSALRLEWLRRTERMEHEASDFSGETGGTHWRSRRLCALWGALVDDRELSRRTTRLREALERERLRLLGLLDAPLCRRLGAPAPVALTLRSTNILAHDPTYRKVAQLWRAWQATAQHLRETERERQQRHAQAAEDFATFGLLLVLRALGSLGYGPEGDPPATAAEGLLTLLSRAGSAKLRWHRGEFLLTIGEATLRITTSPGRLTADRAEAWWRALQATNLEQHAQRASTDEHRLVLLHGGPELAHAASLGPRVARALCGWEWPRVLLVSPWSLDSIERVARVLRVWEVEQRLCRPWPRCKLSSDMQVPAAWTWLASGRSLGFRYPPTAGQFQDAERWWQEQNTYPSPPPRQNREAIERSERRQRDLKAIGQLLSQLRQLAPWSWRICPVCEKETSTATPREDAEERATWQCHCQKCRSEWGLWRCGGCKSLYPVLEVSHEGRDLPSPLPPWEPDRRWGRDVWSEPRSAEGARSFACPRCTRAGKAG